MPKSWNEFVIRMLKIIINVAASLLLLASLAFTQASQQGYEQARRVLDQGIAAMGGLDALRSIKTISRQMTGVRLHQGQSLNPEAKYHIAPLEFGSVIDYANNRSFEDYYTIYIGGTKIKRRTVLKGDSGVTVDYELRTATALTRFTAATARADLRRYPEYLLLRAVARAETLRDLGVTTFSGQPHRVIIFAETDGTQLTLYFNAQTQLLAKYETYSDHPIFGDTLSEFLFADYRNVDGIELPFGLTLKLAGEVIQQLKFTTAKVNVAASARDFEIPDGFEKGTPNEGPFSMTVTKLAEDVYFVSGTTYSAMFIVFNEFVLAVEAPLSDERTQMTIAQIKKVAPGKPIKYLVPTHYHIDHTGGIRGYIAEGATIVTTPGNQTNRSLFICPKKRFCLKVICSISRPKA